MKKFFTLIACALVAGSAFAQDAPAKIDGFKDPVNLIENGSIPYNIKIKGGDFSQYPPSKLGNFVSREWVDPQGNPFEGERTDNEPSRITVDPSDAVQFYDAVANPDGVTFSSFNYCIELIARDDPGDLVDDKGNPKAIDDWDTQFFIKLGQEMKDGAKFVFRMRIKAEKPASADTQTHKGTCGAYQHWAFVGSPSFTTEWTDYENEGTVSGSIAGGDIIAFNLAKLKEANKYYIDDIEFWYYEEIVEEVTSWTDILVNGDLEGAENKCFFAAQPGVEGGWYDAYISDGDGKDGSRGIVLEAVDRAQLFNEDGTPQKNNGQDVYEGTDWDCQFFIRLPQALPAGTQYKFSFDYKADVVASGDIQTHAEPTDYIHYTFAGGSVNFTTEWQHFEAEGKISEDQSKADKPMHSIAFNLSKSKIAAKFFLDNLKFEIPANAVTAAEYIDAKPLPTAINTAKAAKAAKTIYNVAGQQIKSLQKGLNIVNGEKVYVK